MFKEPGQDEARDEKNPVFEPKSVADGSHKSPPPLETNGEQFSSLVTPFRPSEVSSDITSIPSLDQKPNIFQEQQFDTPSISANRIKVIYEKYGRSLLGLANRCARYITPVPLLITAGFLISSLPTPVSRITSLSDLITLVNNPQSIQFTYSHFPSFKTAAIIALATVSYLTFCELIRFAANRITTEKEFDSSTGQEPPKLGTSQSGRIFSKLGNAGTGTSLFHAFSTRMPLVSGPMVGVIGPYLEEATFRALPAMSAAAMAHPWKVGVLTSLIFAGLHNFTFDSENSMRGLPLSPKLPFLGRFKFSLSHVPIPQFALGMLSWGLMQSQGFAACFLTHASINSYLFLRRLLRSRNPH